MTSHEDPRQFTCPFCNHAFSMSGAEGASPPSFCAYCGSPLGDAKEKPSLLPSTLGAQGKTATTAGPVTLISGHIPHEEKIQFIIGPYQILYSIGKGGMGEVFLAYDTTCGRRIALKRIREDLMDHPPMHNRFLKEARITSQLTHPAIIPIYAIHDEENLVYYTMPFVEGETLKQILRKSKAEEKKTDKHDHSGGNIPTLARIFLSICQAVGYAHSKGVLHRDLKPENIIIGKYGEVLILDWGLAKLMRSQQKGDEDLEGPSSTPAEAHPFHAITHLGKVVGTVAYMAPERAMGSPATFQTDIYSLGVILYQILTLKYPFRRGTLKEFRKKMHKEVLYDPSEVAPYRDVPRVLARIALKCLAKEPGQRYENVDGLLHDLENYIEGRSEWFQITDLDIHEKSHWEFQENVLIAEHVAITRGTELSDWVSLMISKDSFTENTKIEADVRIGEKGHGLGFLMSIPEAAERVHLNDGYCLWLGTDLSRSTKLLRSTVEVMSAPDVFLQRNQCYKVRIEKIDNNLHFYLNDALQFSYISHIPLIGTHVGILSRDADFTISRINVSVGGQNITVNCLAVPDAFLAHKDYATALSEYRRIGYSFPGRAEGREAMFRAGITLLEQARATPVHEQSEKLYDQALLEFEKLHGTPGAPLEYLGKALVYQAIRDYEEELKCFELALRRYPAHPLLPVLQEHIVYRMHESSRYHRKATYSMILLALRHLPEVAKAGNNKKLFSSLQKHWEPLPFMIADPACDGSDKLKQLYFAVQLSFWLAKPYVLAEVINQLAEMESPPATTIGNALFCLVELGAWQLAERELGKIQKQNSSLSDPADTLSLIRIVIQANQESLEKAVGTFSLRKPSKLSKDEERTVLYLIEKALDTEASVWLEILCDLLEDCESSPQAKLMIDCAKIKSCLMRKDWAKASEILHKYPVELLSQELTPLHFLYGCWLYAVESKEIAAIHFHSILDVPYPRTWTLFSHYFNGKILDRQGWLQHAFMWEKRQLYRQLVLFYLSTGQIDKAGYYKKLEKEEYINDKE